MCSNSHSVEMAHLVCGFQTAVGSIPPSQILDVVSYRHGCVRCNGVLKIHKIHKIHCIFGPPQKKSQPAIAMTSGQHHWPSRHGMTSCTKTLKLLLTQNPPPPRRAEIIMINKLLTNGTAEVDIACVRSPRRIGP